MGGTCPPARGSVSGIGGGGGHQVVGGSGGNNPYSSWHGTPRADHQPRRSTGNVTELNSLPRQQGRHQMDKHRRSVTCNNDPALVIPLIEYNMASAGHGDAGPGGGGPAGTLLDNGEMLHAADNDRHYSTLDRVDRGGGRVGARPKVNVVSDNRRTYDNANHIQAGCSVGRAGRLGNHVDSEAAEAEDYYPDTNEPTTVMGGHPRGERGSNVTSSVSGTGGSYVKYNSFANY